MALAGAVKGYPVVITLPEKMSAEKVNTLLGLGAKVIRTPTEATWDAPDSHISVANRLRSEIPNAVILDQYSNPANPDAHYFGTAAELWNACGGHIDVVVVGAGTGGTVTGIARRLKELNPNVLVVGVDPIGSVLAGECSPEDMKPYLVEGIGYDFIPKVLDCSVVDKWYRSSDRESFLMARRLIREEGLLCGGSSGAAMAAAISVAKELDLPAGNRVAVILPDSVRNYMNKFLSDDWMLAKGFMEPEELQVRSGTSLLDVVVFENTMIYKKQDILKSASGIVLAEDGKVFGVVTTEKLISKMADSPIEACKASTTDFVIIPENTSLGKALRLLQIPFPAVLKRPDGSLALIDKQATINKLMY